MIEGFENRFAIEYLEFLLQQLQLDNLKRTAIQLFRPAQIKKCILKNGELRRLDKVIKIDFCGFLPSTLLGININARRDDIKELYKNDIIVDKIIELRKQISYRFKALFADKVLDELNNEGIYMQVRLCLPYLYSDLPVSMIRAEINDIWDAEVDYDIPFTGNHPMSQYEWDESYILHAHKTCLRAIAEVIKSNPSLAKIDEIDTAINTFETRFAVIPITSCVMVINEVALSDHYLYAKMTRDNRLAWLTPVNLIRRYRNDRDRAEHKEADIFRMQRRHFLYLWRHDLTLYADMATSFREDNIDGLTKITEPTKMRKKELVACIDWKTKVLRLQKKKLLLNPAYEATDPKEVERIKKWVEYAEIKFLQCTRKIYSKPMEIDQSKLSISITRRGSKYIAIVKHRDMIILEYDGKDVGILYPALAHFAYAKKIGYKNKVPMLAGWGQSTNLKETIIRSLNKKGRIKINLSAEVLFNHLFDCQMASRMTFRLDNINIEDDDLSSINEAVYINRKGDVKIEMPCLHGLYEPKKLVV